MMENIWTLALSVEGAKYKLLFFFTSLYHYSESIRLSQMLLKTELHILHSASASEGKINVQGAILR